LTGADIERRLAALAERYGLSHDRTQGLRLLLDALAKEPDPPTKVAEPGEALELHIADSLVGLEVPALAGAGSVADVGSGAGFPGLPLAAALPGARVDLVESARRKCALIERLIAAARLSNARAVPRRAEEWGAGGGAGAYDAVTARAVAPLAVVVEYGAPLLLEGGVLVAWKGGRDREEERGGDGAAGRVGMSEGEVLRVTPFEGAQRRHLHVFRKVAPTPPAFPRRPGMARKRPLV
jgi:16S rRNA (guanine527-N7)-methyltransferase